MKPIAKNPKLFNPKGFEDCSRLIANLDAEIIQVEDKIKGARDKYGTDIDRRWLYKCRYAIAVKRIQRANLIVKLHYIRKDLKRKHSEHIKSLFMEKCFRILPPSTIDEVFAAIYSDNPDLAPK